ncbi:ATP-binding protein [Haloechinothrix salitolerans]|uniref:ATP-binding protein n=1 Tax=Haloechinothrix salitolerans TaxID=926830 RepID=A0ABW2BZ83_9PSEU
MCTWESDTLSCGPEGCFAPVAGWPQLGQVRAGVRAFLHGVAPDRVADAIQVVDELTSNAARHGRPPIRLHLSRHDNGQTLLVTVSDGSPQPPEPVAVASPAAMPKHFGMRMVDALSTVWGVLTSADGKMVWAELPLAEQAP